MKVPSPCSFCLLLRNEQCGEVCGEKGGFWDERTQVEEKENQVSHPEKKRSWNRDEGDRKRESLVGKNAQKQDDVIPLVLYHLPYSVRPVAVFHMQHLHGEYGQKTGRINHRRRNFSFWEFCVK